MSKIRDEQKQEHIERLKGWIKKGDTVYTVLRHVSGSGMSREIGLVVLLGDSKPEPIFPNYAAAAVLDRKISKRGDGIKIHGCGMDMGFELVYSLSQALYGDGYAIKHRWL